MFAVANDEGIELAAVSGFRSYSRQEIIYQSEIEVAGLEHAQQAVAEPGKSEHQTGLTMDVSSPENNFQLNKAFGSTKAGLWLADNSWEYGFIIRYTEGAEKITGYMYEPWHIRYVGKEYATDMKKRGLTLEEYIQLATE
jgi:D-alanyl-D-alanine carboxypeptidase